MNDRIPFLLHEAVVSLYPAAADGSALTGIETWAGGLANRLRLRMELDEMRIAGSGDLYATTHHIDEEHIIEIGKSWFIRRSDSGDFQPGRNQQYVLELVWQADGYWLKRTYFGVTGRSVGWDSQGVNQFLTDQSFRAQRYTQTGGKGDPEVFTPLPAGEEQLVPFFREYPFIVDEYLLGHYRWDRAATLAEAICIFSPSQNADTVLTLEVGGALTAKTITLPQGAANTPAQVIVDLGDYAVAANQTVRWKITAGPAPEDSAWKVALTLRVNPQ